MPHLKKLANEYGLHLHVHNLNESPTDVKRTPSSPRSPITVQEWIDSIELPENKCEDDVNICSKESYEVEDHLKLGAEAQHLRTESRNVHSDMDCRLQTVLATLAYDPEEVLLNLGFGNEMSDPLMRIPARFFNHSQENNDVLQAFLKQKYEQCELIDAGFCGYRGLSGYQRDSPHFSGIVLKCLQRIRDATRNLENVMQPPTLTVTQASTSMSFFRVAYSVMAVNAFRNSIHRDSSSNQSILEPENQAFLDGQNRPRRRQKGKLILEKNSVALDADEDVFSDASADLEVEQVNIPEVAKSSQQLKSMSHWSRLRKCKLDKEVLLSPTVDVTEKTSVRKKPMRIQRQLSVDEDPESFNQPQIYLIKPENHLRYLSDSINKDSFELEELPLTDDQADEEIICSSEKNMLRTESAISDSSGFLESDTLDAIGTLTYIDDSVTGFRPIMESTSNFSEGDNNSNRENDDDKTREVVIEAERNINFEIGRIWIDKYSDESYVKEEKFYSENKSLKEEFFCDQEDILNNKADDEKDREMHLSVSDRNFKSKEKRFPVLKSSSQDFEKSFFDKHHESRLHLNQTNSTSSLDLSQYKIYFSPFSRYDWLKTKFGSLENLNEEERPINFEIFDDKWSSWRDHNRGQQTNADRSKQAQHLHKSCKSIIDNMQHVMYLYASKLKLMERMCWESYHQIFPGTSGDERRELENLTSLRRLILSEAKKTKNLLNKKSCSLKDNREFSSRSCDSKIVAVADEMQELVREQDKLLKQLKEPFSVDYIKDKIISTAEVSKLSNLNVKEDLLMDIKTTMETDNELFLNQLQTTRQGIEDLKSLLTNFLSPSIKPI